jgi:hypothetical protein
MADAGKNCGLRDKTAPHVQKVCAFYTDSTLVRVLAASRKPTIMTPRQLIYVQKKDDAHGDSHTCTTLVGFSDSNLLSYNQNDGPFSKATFSSSVDIAVSGWITYVLENNPVAVRAVNLETETVKTLKLDLQHVQSPVCMACGPDNKLYIATKNKIYVAFVTSDKCTTFSKEGMFSEIEAMCVNMAKNTLCVADSGKIKSLSLEHGNSTEDQKSEKKREGPKETKIRSLECDRVGNVYATRERGNELVKIDTSGNRTVQSISLAENGIAHMALTGTGDVMLLAFDRFEGYKAKAKYNVLYLKQPSGEPPYINDTCLPLKRKFLEMSMREQRIQQQREDLEHDLEHGPCTVELDDKHSQGTIKIRFNPRMLKRAMEFFRGWERFPNESDNVRLHIDKDVFDDILEFCYTDTLEAQKQEAMQDLDYFGPRLRAADELGFKSMVEYLELTFIKNVTEENAFAMLAFAESMPVKSLIIRMQEYVKTKLKKIAEKSRGAHAELLSHDSLQTLLKSFCNQP